MKVKDRSVLITIIIAIVLMIILGMIFHISAEAGETHFSVSTDAAETAYRTALKTELKNAGIKNAGITLTKQCVDGHTISYQVEIHLPEYINLNEKEMTELTENLGNISMDVEDSTLSFSFS